MKFLSHIAAIPLFAGLDDPQLQELAMIAIDQIFRRGQTIFLEGDDGNGFYVVITGKVKIFKVAPDGKEQILHIFGPGEPFAEVAVFAGQRFPANAEALEESRLFFFPRAAILELIRENPSLALNMLAVLSRRLRQLASLVEDLSLKEVPARLAAYLLYESDRHQGAPEFELEIAKGQLASLLGTIPETLSRMLAKLVKEGLIQSNGPRIKIMEKAGLQELAAGMKRL
jgi:CRP/FNR family transcriptional regulator